MKIKAFAKINLTLDICGKRKDGYHILDSIMQSVTPADIITLETSDNISVVCSDSGLNGEENIAYKAAKKFFEYTNICGGVEIAIEKHIPQAAGMGGGSADAAAVIVGLNKLYNTQLSQDELLKIGLKVGADVPFCIVGGTARVGGIGEELQQLKTPQNLYAVVAKNGVKGSTKEMYAKLDEITTVARHDTPDAVKAIENNDNKTLCLNIGNAFADVCGLYGMEKHFEPTEPLCISLSGSGPTVFALYDCREKAKKAVDCIKAKNIECYLSDFSAQGIVFE